MHRLNHRLFMFAALAAAILIVQARAVEKRPQEKRLSGRTITVPTFDAAATQLELFAGLDDGRLQAQVIPKGPENGFVLISNTTDQALTVALPDSFVAVPVLKQFGPAALGQPTGNGNASGQQNGQQGNQQPVGGGFQSPSNQNSLSNPGNGPGGAGPGFFSIPPERTLRLPYVSACLAHGKPDPTPRSSYVLIRTADYTTDRVLQELIGVVATDQKHRKATQAAIWHRADEMSWKALTQKVSYGVLGQVAYFTAQELQRAKQLVATAEQRSRHSPEASVADNRVTQTQNR